MDLAGFPTKQLRNGVRWYRAHRRELGAWYFDSGPGGRFNLHGAKGTCYAASTAEAAVREIIGPDFVQGRQVFDTLVDARVVSTVVLPTFCCVAKLTDAGAAAYRVSNELSSMTRYGIPQAWAAAFDAHGFDGIWYQPRFSPGEGRALALFGPSGAGDPGTYRTEAGRQSLRSVIEGMPGIEIIPTRRLTDYVVLDEPLEE